MLMLPPRIEAVAAEVPAGVLVEVEVARADVLAGHVVAPLEPVAHGASRRRGAEAEVVDVEARASCSRRSVLKRVLSPAILPNDTEPAWPLSVVAFGSTLDVVGVGPLEAVDGVLLQARDRLGVARDVAAGPVAGDAVDRRQAPVVVDAAGVRVVGQEADVSASSCRFVDVIMKPSVRLVRELACARAARCSRSAARPSGCGSRPRRPPAISASSCAVTAVSAPIENRPSAAGQLRRADDRRRVRLLRVLVVGDVRPSPAARGRCGASRTGRCSCRRCSPC